MAQRMTVLLLPGQGAHRERMAAGLYRRQPEFTARADALFGLLGPAGDRLARQWLRPAPNPAIGDAAVAQPLLLITGYALGSAVGATAQPPDLLLGHSVGELAAACLAGVFSPADLAAVVADRASTLGREGRGGMLAVAAAPGDLDGLLEAGVAVAAVNGPRQLVLAGPGPGLVATTTRLRAAGVTVRSLRSDQAFHSAAMRQAADRFRAGLSRLKLSVPHTTVISARTAAPVTPAQAVDPAFWADQLALPVYYWPALRSLLDGHGTQPGLVLLDASADRSLSAAARRHPAVRGGASVIVPLLGPAPEAGGPTDATAFATAIESLALLTARAGQA